MMMMMMFVVVCYIGTGYVGLTDMIDWLVFVAGRSAGVGISSAGTQWAVP